VGILSGLAPWIVYWVLVGNVPLTAAAVITLTVAISAFVIGRWQGKSWPLLEIGAVATFLVLTILTFALSAAAVERWALPASIIGLLLVALIGVLTGRPFAGEYADASTPTDETRRELFARMHTLVTWVWVGAFAGMAISSSIPAIVDGDATILDPRTPLSFVCYWAVPFALLGVAALAARVLVDRMTAAANSPDVVRRTTFVAFRELAIDELYYLARQKAEREVGAGMEAYNVQVGSAGVPLTGDESRESWPATYKVRPRR
jgi:hypothetical protein